MHASCAVLRGDCLSVAVDNDGHKEEEERDELHGDGNWRQWKGTIKFKISVGVPLYPSPVGEVQPYILKKKKKKKKERMYQTG